MRADVGRFAKIAGSRILPWDQISRLDQDPVRHAIMAMAAVIIGGRRKGTGERIYPGTRADAVLIAIQAGGVWIRAPRAELWTWVTGRARVTSAANTIL